MALKAPPNDAIKQSSSASSSDTHMMTENMSSKNIRIAIVGNVDAGKSTLIGTLKSSTLDDGNGSSRSHIVKLQHEAETGRTSSISQHLVGFDNEGHMIASEQNGGKDLFQKKKEDGKVRLKSEQEIGRESDRIVTLVDLAGHERYFKTTIHGITSGMVDYAMLLVDSRHPPNHMTNNHLKLCCAFGIPVIIVLTKIDACPEHAMKNTKNEVLNMFRSPEVGRKPYAIHDENDIETCKNKLATLAPLMKISCVSGEGLDVLHKLLVNLPKRRRHQNKIKRPFEFLIEEVFTNVPGIGLVVSGFVNSGSLSMTEEKKKSSKIFIGPLQQEKDNDWFLSTTAKSFHVARTVTSEIHAGQSACMALSLKSNNSSSGKKKENRKKSMIRPGMVIVEDEALLESNVVRSFDAEICVLKGREGTSIKKNYETYLHILHVRQVARVMDIELLTEESHVSSSSLSYYGGMTMGDDGDGGVLLRAGSRAKIRFEFKLRPEYVRKGMKILFRDGHMRGVGVITNLVSNGNGG